MVLARNIVTGDGRTVLVAGLSLGPAHLLLLQAVAAILVIREPVRVTVD